MPFPAKVMPKLCGEQDARLAPEYSNHAKRRSPCLWNIFPGPFRTKEIFSLTRPSPPSRQLNSHISYKRYARRLSRFESQAGLNTANNQGVTSHCNEEDRQKEPRTTLSLALVAPFSPVSCYQLVAKHRTERGFLCVPVDSAKLLTPAGRR